MSHLDECGMACPQCGGRCCGRVTWVFNGEEFDCHDEYEVGCKYRGHESEWTKETPESVRIARALTILAEWLEAERERRRPWENESQRAALLRQAAEFIEGTSNERSEIEGSV